MYTVKDRDRRLKFDGIKLAESSSQSPGRTRWVEFALYRTASGQYVLSRVGVSLYYHRENCSIVRRNNIEPVASSELPMDLVPCEQCSPYIEDEDFLYPETARYWAQTSHTADGVVESLYKYDEHGARYLTNVARKLLVDAAAKDDRISETFFNEYIE